MELSLSTYLISEWFVLEWWEFGIHTWADIQFGECLKWFDRGCGAIPLENQKKWGMWSGGFNFLAWSSWPSHWKPSNPWDELKTAKQFCFWISPLGIYSTRYTRFPSISIVLVGRSLYPQQEVIGSISWVISEHPRSYPVIAVPWTSPKLGEHLHGDSKLGVYPVDDPTLTHVIPF